VPHTDILINNVGVYGPKDFFVISDAEWQYYFEINVMSGVRLSRAYLPGMLERDRGRIVFISSSCAWLIFTCAVFGAGAPQRTFEIALNQDEPCAIRIDDRSGSPTAAIIQAGYALAKLRAA